MILSDYRKRIDEVDDEIVRLINKRAQMSLEAGRMKAEAGLPERDLQREWEIVQRVTQRNAGPLSNALITKIFNLLLNEK